MQTQQLSGATTSPHLCLNLWSKLVTDWHPHGTLTAPKKTQQKQEMCIRMGPFFSVRLSERCGRWLETLLYHRSLCGTFHNIWTAVRGIIIVFFWPSDETGMRFLICCFWVFLFDCYLQSCYQASCWNVHLAENGLKTACIKGDTWRHSDVKDSFKSVSKHCHSVTSVCQPWQDACAHVQKHRSPAVLTVFHRSHTWRTWFPMFVGNYQVVETIKSFHHNSAYQRSTYTSDRFM